MSDVAKMRFLIEEPIRDATHPTVAQMGRRLRVLAEYSPVPHWTVAHLAHAVARDCVAYMTDVDRVGEEQIDGFTGPRNERWGALAPFIRGCDDCDAKARLFVALALAAGLRAKLEPYPSERAVLDGQPLTHVFAAVYLPQRVVNQQGASEGGSWSWYPVETILARAVIGDAPKETPKEAQGECAGRWLYP